jgi:hypothetical protein
MSRPGKSQLGEAVTAYGPPLLAQTLAETTGQTAAAWTKISIPADDMAGAVVLPTSGQRTPHLVFYTNAGPQDRFFLSGEYLLANDGVCIFPTRGDWWILLPQAGAAPVTYNFILFDAQGLSPLLANLIAAQGGGSSGGSPSLPGIFDTGAVSESQAANLVRAAVTGQNIAAAAGAKNKPINSDVASVAGGRSLASIESLYVNAIIGGQSSGNFIQVAMGSVVTPQAYALNRFLTDTFIRGDDGATYSAIGARGALTAQANTLIRLLVDGAVRGQDVANGNWAGINSDLASVNTRNMSAVEGLYTLGLVYGSNVLGGTITAINALSNSAPRNGRYNRSGSGLAVNAVMPVSDQCVSVTGAAAAAVTATLPAPGANLRQYITRIQIVKFASALLVAGATPVLVTTTGIPATPTFSFDAAADVAGSAVEMDIDFPTNPIEASADNAACTIVCPATTSIIWRVNVWYYNG